MDDFSVISLDNGVLARRCRTVSLTMTISVFLSMVSVWMEAAAVLFDAFAACDGEMILH